jgi:FtsP/CotA-like multicopper oxidase with cupredoxin domain
MTVSRRDLLATGAALGGAALLAGRAGAQPAGAQPAPAQHQHQHGQPGAGSGVAAASRVVAASLKPLPVPPAAVAPLAAGKPGTCITPGGASLPWKMVRGARVFHLVAEPVRHTIAPGLAADCWGYNGRVHGPTIEAVEGDLCRFYVSNRLPEPTTVHWHGVLVPNGMDGAAGLTQKAIQPGETFRYEFRMPHAGTFLYHPHFDEMTQIALGLTGMIVVHPRRPGRPARDYALLLHEWDIPIGASRPDPLEMSDFNVLTINGKAFPATVPIAAERGDLVRIRFGNLGPMDHHPMHLHGHRFRLVGTDGGAVPRSAQHPETTVLVPVGTTRVVEFEAAAAGDWPLHCHMTHHVMNQMGHESVNAIGADLAAADRALRQVDPGYMSMGQAGSGNMADMGMPVPGNSISMLGGVGPFGTIDMGGMFTILKVRERLAGGAEAGWYAHPAASVARPASAAELAADGIDVK